MTPYPHVNPLHLLSLEKLPIFEQLQLEEALLRTDGRNWCLINEGSPPAIVMGLSGKLDLLVDRNLLVQHPVPVIRRMSGGGTVFIDENTLFVSWIFNVQHINIPCCPSKIHASMEALYRSALPSLSMRLQENDYVIGNRKFGGTAQYLRKHRWLHHSTFLWDFESRHMDYLQMPLKTPRYRQKRPHDQFLCRLKDHFPSKNALRNQLLQLLSQQFQVKEVSLIEAMSVIAREHHKSTCYVN